MRRITTSSLEDALDQIIRVQTAGGSSAFKPEFMTSILKELIDRRREEELIFAEVEEIFGDDLRTLISKIEVEEVLSLSELGNSSFPSEFDLEKVEWKLQEELDEPEGEDEEDEALDDSDVVHNVYQRPILRTKSGISSGMHDRWLDSASSRRAIIYILLAVISLIFCALMLV